MTTRDKEKIRVLISEAIVYADSNKDYLTGLDDDCEEVTVECLPITTVKMLLDNLKEKLLKDDDPNAKPVCTCEASYGCRMFQEGIKYGRQAADASREIDNRRCHQEILRTLGEESMMKYNFTDAKLEQCPFCGDDIYIEVEKRIVQTVCQNYHQEWEARWSVHCVNPYCEVQPRTREYSMLSEAIEVWNKRPGDWRKAK